MTRCVVAPAQGVEHKLDVGVASFASTGAAIGGLDPTDLYIQLHSP